MQWGSNILCIWRTALEDMSRSSRCASLPFIYSIGSEHEFSRFDGLQTEQIEYSSFSDEATGNAAPFTKNRWLVHLKPEFRWHHTHSGASSKFASATPVECSIAVPRFMHSEIQASSVSLARCSHGKLSARDDRTAQLLTCLMVPINPLCYLLIIHSSDNRSGGVLPNPFGDGAEKLWRVGQRQATNQGSTGVLTIFFQQKRTRGCSARQNTATRLTAISYPNCTIFFHH